MLEAWKLSVDNELVLVDGWKSVEGEITGCTTVLGDKRLDAFRDGEEKSEVAKLLGLVEIVGAGTTTVGEVTKVVVEELVKLVSKAWHPKSVVICAIVVICGQEALEA